MPLRRSKKIRREWDKLEHISFWSIWMILLKMEKLLDTSKEDGLNKCRENKST
jgi:hypothetical protein